LNHRLLLAGLALALAGCQSAHRPYDGVLGYQAAATTPATAAAPAQVTFFYVDEARRDWVEVESRARKACARTLGVAPAATVLDVRERRELTRTVDMSLAIPAGPLGLAAGANGKGGVTVQGNSVRNELGRELRLRRLDAACSAGAAGAP
jgi:allophanate hydrolase subunit 1